LREIVWDFVAYVPFPFVALILVALSEPSRLDRAGGEGMLRSRQAHDSLMQQICFRKLDHLQRLQGELFSSQSRCRVGFAPSQLTTFPPRADHPQRLDSHHQAMVLRLSRLFHHRLLRCELGVKSRARRKLTLLFAGRGRHHWVSPYVLLNLIAAKRLSHLFSFP